MSDTTAVPMQCSGTTHFFDGSGSGTCWCGNIKSRSPIFASFTIVAAPAPLSETAPTSPRDLKHERREKAEALRVKLVAAMKAAWDDYCTDTGCYPEFIRVSGQGKWVEAHFDRSPFAGWVAEMLVDDFQPGVSRSATAQEPTPDVPRGEFPPTRALVEQIRGDLARLIREKAQLEAQLSALSYDYSFEIQSVSLALGGDPEDYDSLEQHAKHVVGRLSESESRVAALQADAERWRIVKRGLFVTPHPIDPEALGEVEVVFQSGWLDEFASTLYHANGLVLDDRGIAFDIIPVVDAARAARSTPPDPKTENG